MRIIQVLAFVLILTGVGAFVATTYSQAAGTAVDAAATQAPAAAPAAAPVAGPPAGYTGQFAHAFTERSFGKPDAPVTLVEYAALTCPHCAHVHATVMPQLKKTYIDAGLVRVVFRDFPFNEIGLKAAMAARCAPEQGYYDFLQALFAAQAQWGNPSVGDTLLKQMAGFAGLSPAMYDACVKDQDLSGQLLQERVNATNDLQISSTPTILVEGTLERVVGAQEYVEYQKIIDRQLTKLGIAVPEQAPAAAVPAAPAAPEAHEGHAHP